METTDAAAVQITDAQLDKMRHAVAWPKCYRNYYDASESDTPDWEELVVMGYAFRRQSSVCDGRPLYHVTQAGLDLLLELW